MSDQIEFADDIPVFRKEFIIKQELAGLSEQKYALEISYRVNKKIGADQSILDKLTNELIKIEKIIEEYKSEFIKLPKRENNKQKSVE